MINYKLIAANQSSTQARYLKTEPLSLATLNIHSITDAHFTSPQSPGDPIMLHYGKTAVSLPKLIEQTDFTAFPPPPTNPDDYQDHVNALLQFTADGYLEAGAALEPERTPPQTKLSDHSIQNINSKHVLTMVRALGMERTGQNRRFISGGRGYDHTPLVTDTQLHIQSPIHVVPGAVPEGYGPLKVFFLDTRGVVDLVKHSPHVAEVDGAVLPGSFHIIHDGPFSCKLEEPTFRFYNGQGDQVASQALLGNCPSQDASFDYPPPDSCKALSIVECHGQLSDKSGLSIPISLGTHLLSSKTKIPRVMPPETGPDGLYRFSRLIIASNTHPSHTWVNVSVLGKSALATTVSTLSHAVFTQPVERSIRTGRSLFSVLSERETVHTGLRSIVSGLPTRIARDAAYIWTTQTFGAVGGMVIFPLLQIPFDNMAYDFSHYGPQETWNKLSLTRLYRNGTYRFGQSSLFYVGHKAGTMFLSDLLPSPMARAVSKTVGCIAGSPLQPFINDSNYIEASKKELLPSSLDGSAQENRYDTDQRHDSYRHVYETLLLLSALTINFIIYEFIMSAIGGDSSI